MMLIEAAYPKCLGTPRQRRIKGEETSAAAVSMTSSSLVVRSAPALQTSHAGLPRGHKLGRCVWSRHHALWPERIQQQRRGEATGRGHCSGTPALRRPSRTDSVWARYVGSSLIAVQAARAREMAKAGSSARPALTAERASAVRPSCARAAANEKYACGKFRLASIARRNQATACS